MCDGEITHWVDAPCKDEALIRVIKHDQARLSDDERLEWWAMLKEGYCEHCGRALKDANDKCFCSPHYDE